MEFLAGSLSAIITRIIIAPIDTIKIRTQLSPPSTTLGSTLQRLTREGKQAYWKGNMAALYLYIVYGGVQFHSLKYIRPHVYNLIGSPPSPSPPLSTVPSDTPPTRIARTGLGEGLAGGMAASIATIVSFPFDTIRTYHASLTHSPKSPSIVKSVRDITRGEGVIRGLYRGLFASLMYVHLQMSVVFYVHEEVRRRCTRQFEMSRETSALVGGMAGGFCGKAVTMPLDVVRKRMQCKPDSVYYRPGYDSFSSGLKLVVSEGYRGMFRGFTYACTKSVVSSGVTFWSYAVLMKLLKPLS